MSRLIRTGLHYAAAEPPDDHCASCGAGIFTSVLLSDLGRPKGQRFAIASRLMYVGDTEAMTDDIITTSHNVCQTCAMLEDALIEATGTCIHPERLASYDKMMERF